ncbi:MAG: YggT family protein [Clostridia bacterium]|nr:YggT family protein [Clostridia bacterium]
MFGMTYVIRRVVILLLDSLQLLMLAMAVMSWIPQLRESRVYQIVCSVVEPIIDPFRRLLYRIPGMDRFPLDLSFLAAWIVLSLVRGLL